MLIGSPNINRKKIVDINVITNELFGLTAEELLEVECIIWWLCSIHPDPLSAPEELYRKKEKAIGIPIIVERSFFQLSETERREFLVSSMLSKFNTLENVVKNKKLDTNITKLVHDFSYNLRTFV